jgi:hypothetical protein
MRYMIEQSRRGAPEVALNAPKPDENPERGAEIVLR